MDALGAPGIGGKISKRVGGIISAGVECEPEPYESDGLSLRGLDVTIVGTTPFGVLRGERRVGEAGASPFSNASGGVRLRPSLLGL